MGGLIVVVFLALLVVVTIFLGVRIIPQGQKAIVQRLGKYHCTLGPGLNIIIPYIDSVAYRVSTKDQVLDIPPQEVVTKDNAVVITNAIAFINVVSPEKAVYGVENFGMGIRQLVQTSLRSMIGEMNLDEVLSSRERIKAGLKAAISDDISEWGILLKSVEIQDIRPSATMQAAMEAQAAAERNRRATVTKAEGEKSAAILEAEGRLAAAEKDARAKEVQAQASQNAIQMVLQAAGEGKSETAIRFLLGEGYIKAIQETAGSPNAKVVLLPADLQSAIRGLFAGVGK